jgi:hypothetical protein
MIQLGFLLTTTSMFLRGIETHGHKWMGELAVSMSDCVTSKTWFQADGPGPHLLGFRDSSSSPKKMLSSVGGNKLNTCSQIWELWDCKCCKTKFVK